MKKAQTKCSLMFLPFSAIIAVSCLAASLKTESVASAFVPPDSVRTIEFCELESGGQENLEIHVVHVVTNASEIGWILKNIVIKEEIPVTKAIYTRLLRVERRDAGEPVTISYHEPYYEKAGIQYSSLRVGSREYKTNRKTIEFLNGAWPEDNGKQ